MGNTRLDEAQAGIKIARKNINDPRYADDTNDKKQRGTKELLDEDEREEWKSWLETQHSKNQDHGIWSHHLWQIDGETMETMKDFIFLGSKITVDGDCIHEIKRTLASWKERYDKPRQHIKKQRHHFANEGPCSQKYDFSSSHVWM